MTIHRLPLHKFIVCTRQLLLDFETYSILISESNLAHIANTKIETRLLKRIHLLNWLLYHRLNPIYPYFSELDRKIYLHLYHLLKTYITPERLSKLSLSNQSIYNKEVKYLPFFLVDKSELEPNEKDVSFLNQVYEELENSANQNAKGLDRLKKWWRYGIDFFILLLFIVRYPFIRWVKYRFRDPLITDLLKTNHKFHSVWDGIDTSSDVLSFYVYKRGLRESIKGRARLAELTFFTIQLGDELIDQLSIQIGVSKIAQIIGNHHTFFSIAYDRNLNQFYIPSSLADFEKEGINMDLINDKFKISYRVLFEIIGRLLSRMNVLLQLANYPNEAGRRIQMCFEHCLSTYYDDLLINELSPNLKFDWHKTKWYYFKKTNAVLITWLVLRASLFDTDPLKYKNGIKEWGYLLHNLQIYDDLKDMKVDFSFQPNMAHIVASHSYPLEFSWFEKHQTELKENIRFDEIVRLSLEMPATIATVMAIARNEATKNLNSFTLLMVNYCWTRNWSQSFMNFYLSGFHFNLLNHPSLQEIYSNFKTGNRKLDLFLTCLIKTKSAFSLFPNKSFYFDYLFNLCLFDSKFRIHFHLTNSPIQSFYIIRRFHYMQTGHKERLLLAMLKPLKKEIEKYTLLINDIQITDYIKIKLK